jgi:Skp family chaperone for outer membrane proteins
MTSPGAEENGMSGDTAAFLAGCAVTGVAALLLARGEFANGQSSGLQPMQSVMPSSVATPVAPLPTTDRLEDVQRGWQVQTKLEQQQDVARNLTDQLKSQQSIADELKNQVAKQQTESEDLKNQLDKQQRNTEQLIAQLQEQQRVIDRMAAAAQQSRSLPDEFRQPNDNSVQTIVLAVGAVILVVIVVGAIVLVGVILLVAMSRRRQPRTVHVVQPMPPGYGALAEQPLLPQRSAKPPRQTKQIDVDYYVD